MRQPFVMNRWNKKNEKERYLHRVFRRFCSILIKRGKFFAQRHRGREFLSRKAQRRKVRRGGIFLHKGANK